MFEAVLIAAAGVYLLARSRRRRARGLGRVGRLAQYCLLPGPERLHPTWGEAVPCVCAMTDPDTGVSRCDLCSTLGERRSGNERGIGDSGPCLHPGQPRYLCKYCAPARVRALAAGTAADY